MILVDEAGMSGMRYRTFLLWNLIGGLIWAPGCVLLGYAFSKSLDVVGKTLTYAPLIILALVVGVVVIMHVRRRRREADEGEAFADADAAAEN